MTDKPKPLTKRIWDWAGENPYGMISAEQGASLFGCTADQFRKAIRNLRADGRDCLGAKIVWQVREAGQ